MNSLRTLLLATSAISMTTAGSAFAQTAENSENIVQEIIVTAQRRAESLQSVPIAVVAANASTLASVNITTAMDIGKIAPTVQLQANNGAVQTFMRGVGTDISPVGDEQSNALYIDGVYFARLSPVLFRLNNIDRVEVLKGPQGTLFGRNATAGLIHIVTRDPKPGQPLNGEFSIGYGNYETVEASGYVSAGLGDMVATDLSGYYSNQNKGWGKNLFNGQDVSKARSYAIRNKWVFEFSEATRITLAGDYARESGDIGVTQRYYGDGAVPTGSPDGAGTLAPLGFYDRNEDGPSFSTSRTYGGYARIEQNIGFAKVTNTIAYRNLKQRYGLDNDFSPLTYNHNQLPSYAKQFSNELQIASLPESSISWIAGLYYMDQHQGYTPASFVGQVFAPAAQLFAPADQKVKSIAGYAEATVPVGEKVRFTGGLRYSHDKLNAGGGISAFIPGFGTVPIQPFQRDKASFGKLTWKAVVDYKPVQTVMLYASLSRGFKSGVFNLLTYNPVPVKEEVLDAYEIGFKSDLLGRRLRINGSAFYYDWKNPQVQVIPSSGTSAFVNAGGARVKGVELEANAVVTKGLSLNLAATYLDGTFTSFLNAPSYVRDTNPPFWLITGPSFNADGTRLPHAPKLSAVAGIQYHTEVNESQRVGFGINYAHTSKFFWHVDHRNAQNALGLLDANIWYSFANDAATVKLWGSNLTNKKYYNHQYEITGSPGDGGATAAPRTYGVKLSYKFN